jgi:hypothetical protein
MLRDKIRPRFAEVTVQRRRDTYFPNAAEERQAIAATSKLLADRFSWEFDDLFLDKLRELLALPITDRGDLRWKIERAFETGELVAVPDAPPTRGTAPASAPAVSQPALRPRSVALTPSMAFGRMASVAAVARSYASQTPPRLPADDFFAIMAANPGDVLPDGSIASAIKSTPFEYVPHTLTDEAMELAASTNNPKFAAKMLGYSNAEFRDMVHRFKETLGIGPDEGLCSHHTCGI